MLRDKLNNIKLINNKLIINKLKLIFFRSHKKNKFVLIKIKK